VVREAVENEWLESLEKRVVREAGENEWLERLQVINSKLPEFLAMNL